MFGSISEIPVKMEAPGIRLREVEWGGQTVGFTEALAQMDPAPLFVGLPDDRCQCPHWGYVIEGSVRFRFADHEETYRAGDVYYAPPGHTPVVEAGARWVDFSPTDLWRKTAEVTARNMAARG